LSDAQRRELFRKLDVILDSNQAPLFAGIVEVMYRHLFPQRSGIPPA
jgi:hypothetical protein